MVPSLRFQTFFAQAFKIGVDSWKFSMLLLYISYATQKLMLDSCNMVEKLFEAFHTFLWHFFQSLKHNFIAYCFSNVSSRPDCIFEIHQLWQSGFSREYSKRESVRDDETCGGNKEVNTPELIGQTVRVRVTMLKF